MDVKYWIELILIMQEEKKKKKKIFYQIKVGQLKVLF